MFKYRLPSRTGLFKKSLEWQLQKIRKQIAESRNDGFRGLVARAMLAFRTFLTHLGKPQFKFTPIIIDNNIATADYYNDIRDTIREDLNAAEEDITNLGAASIESFNVAQILAKELEVLAAQAASKAQDLALISRDPKSNLLIAGDNFTNKNLINMDIPLSMPLAYIDTQQGIVTLARAESQSVIDTDRAEIEVKPITPGIDDKSSSYKDNLGRFYEGKFYALAGRAEPEGGEWHLEELTSTPADKGFSYKYENYRKGKNGKKFHLSKYEYSGNEESMNPIGAYVDENGDIVIKNEIIIRDRGATLEEKNAIRKNMIDGDSGTYWQCEYVIRPSTFGTTGPILQGKRWGEVNKKGKKKGEQTEGNQNYTPAKVTDLRGTFTETGAEDDKRLQVTPDDLRTAAKTFDNMDLDITITIKLPEPVEINWVNLVPMNFGETAWLRIVNIEVAESKGKVFRQLPNFSGGYSQNILTEDVNSELSTETTETILSPSRFAYRGTGVWTFPTRKVQMIRFTLSQQTPIPVLYQKIRMQMHRTWEALYKHKFDTAKGKVKSRSVKRAEWTQVITLSYLQSVEILQGVLTADDVAPTTDPTSFHKTKGHKHLSVNRYNLSTPFNDVLNSLGLGMGHKNLTKHITDEEDSGFYMEAYWIQTFYDLIGYRIGIREIGAFRNIYDTNSTIISTPFISPVDIQDITLRVDDQVPDGTSINYFISPDDGRNWYEINPLDKPSIYGNNGFAVPKTISFNLPGDPGNEAKHISTDTPVRSIMFKAEMTSDQNTTSPVLKSYKLIMYPSDSYRPQEFES